MQAVRKNKAEIRKKVRKGKAEQVRRSLRIKKKIRSGEKSRKTSAKFT